jgi:hypothetical protein
MAEVVRTLKKQGAKNRAINNSVKEAMQTIKEQREIKEKERLAAWAARKAKEREDGTNKQDTTDDNSQEATTEIQS